MRRKKHSQVTQVWEDFGAKDPYFGVVSEEKFRSDSLTKDNKEAFFASGIVHVEKVFSAIKRHFDPEFSPRKAIDFGCGVGRILIPLAQRCDSVVGIDVSPSMLTEARKNCDENRIKNVRFYEDLAEFESSPECFDMVHTYIVLQHIPTKAGQKNISALINLLNAGGIGVIQLHYGQNKSVNSLIYWAVRNIPFSKNFVNLFTRRKFWEPRAQMNQYNLNWVFKKLQSEGITDVHCSLEDHGGALGVIVYFKKCVN